MNFSPITIETAAGFIATVKRALTAPEDVHPSAVRSARAMAIRWGGLDPEELNALAGVCGHPFAPDLPPWMLGLDVQLVARWGKETARVSFGSRDYNHLTAEGWTQTIREWKDEQ